MAPPSSTSAAARATARPAPKRAAPAPRPRLRLFEPPARPRVRGHRRRIPAAGLAVALVVASVLAVVVADDILAQGQIQLSANQQAIAAATTVHHQLQLQAAQLAAPPVIVTQAEGTFGMVSPGEVIDLPAVPLDVPLPVPVTTPTGPTGATPAPPTPSSPAAAT